MQETFFGSIEEEVAEVEESAETNSNDLQTSVLKEILIELKRIRFASEILIDQSTENVK